MKNTNLKSKILSGILAVSMAVGILPLSAFAEDTAPTNSESITAVTVPEPTQQEIAVGSADTPTLPTELSATLTKITWAEVPIPAPEGEAPPENEGEAPQSEWQATTATEDIPVAVEWVLPESETFSADEVKTFTYTAKLTGDAYVVSPDVVMPTFTVNVVAAPQVDLASAPPANTPPIPATNLISDFTEPTIIELANGDTRIEQEIIVTFPTFVLATVDGNENVEVPVTAWTRVSPSAETAFSTATQAEYYYEPTLAEGYTLAETAILPNQLVKVGDVVHAPMPAAVTEQFNLPVGGTYYFDLSSEAGNIGTINTDLPDVTLNYVPFTYAGTVNAYSLNSASSGVTTSSVEASTETDPTAQYGYTYDHSLFVADYNVSHTVSWNMLNTDSLIFGKTYDTNYTLRSLSVGSDTADNSTNLGGTPTNNEWDMILGKTGLENPIKNVVSGLYSLGQDTYAGQDDNVAMRGSRSTDYWWNNYVSGNFNSYGFRPALEVLNPAALGADGLKTITLNLNGGHLGDDTAVTSMNMVYTGASYTAPNTTSLTRPAGNSETFFAWNTLANGSGTTYAPGASVPNTVTTLYAMWIGEQFNLPMGETYYFDLSGEAGNIGTINTALPDDTLHYVPFTYAGTVNAYSLTNASSGDRNASTTASANPTYRSLFVADYNVSHTVSWNRLTGLNDDGIGTIPSENLIFGKPYDTNYTLRSLSAGSDTNAPNPGGDPTNNEWDVILDKNGGYIQNWSGIFSWGQDTYLDAARAARGSSSANAWVGPYGFHSLPDFGFRPALEVLNPTTLGIDGLRAISLNLNGGSFNSENSINIVSAGDNYTAPPAEGLTRPADNTETFFAWNTQADGSGTAYAPGASVPSTVTMLYAQWIEPIISLNPSTNHTFPTVEAGYGEQPAYSVTVSNTGNVSTGDLTVALSGTNKDAFTLDKTALTSLPTSGTATFTVKPNVGLAAGTYTATVTVSGANNISQSFDLSFTVNAAPPTPTPTPTEPLPFVPNGTVDLENSTVPSGNTLHITEQSEAKQQEDLAKLREYAQQNGITGEVHFLADITMTDANGNEVQPQNGNTRVRINVPGLTTQDTVTVLHIKDDGTVEEIRPVTIGNGYVEFAAPSFSVYSVIVHKAQNTGNAGTTTPLSPQTGIY